MTTPIQRASYLEAHSRPDTPPAPKNLAPINNSPTFFAFVGSARIHLGGENETENTSSRSSSVISIFQRITSTPSFFNPFSRITSSQTIPTSIPSSSNALYQQVSTANEENLDEIADAPLHSSSPTPTGQIITTSDELFLGGGIFSRGPTPIPEQSINAQEMNTTS